MILKIAKTLAILYAGFFTTFAIFSGAEKIDGIKGLIFNLPNALPWFLVWGALFVAWKCKKLGGLLFLVLAIASMFFFHSYQELSPFLIITSPLFVIGGLFLFGSKN